MAQNVVRHFEAVDRLLEASQEEIEEVDGIGPERAEILVEWFADEQHRRLVAELLQLGLKSEAGDELKPLDGPLTGETYVITGTLESMTREDAAAELEARGAKVAGSVSKKTTAVVVGEEPGATKLKKFGKRGVGYNIDSLLGRVSAWRRPRASGEQ